MNFTLDLHRSFAEYSSGGLRKNSGHPFGKKRSSQAQETGANASLGAGVLNIFMNFAKAMVPPFS